ncbi:MAG: CBS domain-containing protein [Mycobacteriaceae bacterium]
MNVADVLAAKGSAVVTVAPTATVTELLAVLAHHGVGAAVVRDGQQTVGIVSERDVVRALDLHGAEVLVGKVAEIMTVQVVTCAPTESLERVSVVMTEQRARHVPVVADGHLVGVVSIGDVVKSQIAQLEHDRAQLTAYISQG